jgi:hypothetical protein
LGHLNLRRVLKTAVDGWPIPLAGFVFGTTPDAGLGGFQKGKAANLSGAVAATEGVLSTGHIIRILLF